MATLKIKFNGTEYLIKDTKLKDAISAMHARFGVLEERPGLYQNGKLVESWDSLVSSGAIVVNDGVVSTGKIMPDGAWLPNKNEYGFYFNTWYSDTTEGYGLKFFEDGSFVCGNLNYGFNSYSAGTIIYGDGVIDATAANFGIISLSTDGESMADEWGYIYNVTLNSPENEYGFMYDTWYYTAHNYPCGFIFHEDGSFEYGTEYEIYNALPAGSAKYSNGLIDAADSFNLVLQVSGDVMVDSYYGDTFYATPVSGRPAELSGTLVLSDGGDITAIGSNAFSNNANLTGVVVPDSVEYINNYAFDGCYNLGSLDLGNGVRDIRESAFHGCANLSTLTIPNSVYNIDYSAFENCYGLMSVTVGSGVTNIGSSAFYGCSNIIEVINYSSLNIEAGSDDHGEIAVNALEVHSESNSKIITTDEGCVYYASTAGSYLLSYPGTETEIVLPDSINGLPYAIGPNVFNGREDVTSVIIPEGVTGIGAYAFYGCGFDSIVIPNSVVSIGDRAFKGCSNLQAIHTNSLTAWCNIEFELDTANPLTYGNISLYVNNELVTELVIPNDVKYIKNDSFNNCVQLTRVTIPEGVISIGDSAFYNCTNLTDIAIPESVTGIGNYAFYGCTGLTKLDVPNNVTNIGEYAFYGCNGLTEISLSSNLTTIGASAFYNCSNVTELEIPNSVTEIGTTAFRGCTNLEKVYTSDAVSWCNINFGGSASPVYENSKAKLYINNELPTEIILTDNVTQIPNFAFAKCDTLTNITIPASVTSIGHNAFSDCTALTDITIPDSVTFVGSGAFSNCVGLTEIVIPDSVTSMGTSPLKACSGLTDVTVPFLGMTAINTTNLAYCLLGSLFGNNFTGGTPVTQNYDYGRTTTWYIPSGLKNVTVNSGQPPLGAFSGCSMLESITLGEGVTAIKDLTFSGCTGLTKLVIPSTVTTMPSSSVLYGCDSLIELTIPFVGRYATATTLGENTVFGWIFGKSGNSGTTTVKQYYKGSSYVTYSIPSSLKKVTVLGGDMPYGAFYNCSMLEDVVIGDSVTSIGEKAFYNCTGLKSSTISDSVTSIGSAAFYECSALVNVIIGNGVKSIGGEAFYRCPELASVTIGNSVTSIGGYAFNGCKRLTSIVIPDSVTSIGNSTFGGCTGLTSITIPNSVTSIDYFAFYGCTGLTSAHTDSIENWCNISFANNTANPLNNAGNLYLNDELVTALEIPDSMTSINSFAFNGCTCLTSVTIPDNVTSIGTSAFLGCTSLANIAFEGTVEQWNAITKGDYWNNNVPATEITCSDGSVTL